MADTKLGYSSNLQIVIVPSGKEYSTPASKKGLLIFREGTNIIEVNGHEYQAAKTGDLSKITTALKNTGYLTVGSDGVLTAQDPGTVAALLGEKIGTSGDDKKTVSAWINDILGKISGINANISNLQSLTNTKGAGAFVVRDKSGDGKTDFANTTAIQAAITDAKTAAINAAKEDASEKDTQVKKDLIGNGTTSASQTEPLKVDGEDTWAKGETKTLSSLKDLILNLQSQLTTLSGKDLTAVNNAIKAIKKELTDGSEAGDLANTLIDKLSTFLGGKTTWTINGTNATNVAAIITALEGQIKAVQSKHSVVTDGVEGNAEAGNTNYAVVTSSTTNEKTTYTVKTTKTLETALSNAKTTITTVDGTGGKTNYITVAKNTSGHDNYTIATTSALDTVASKAAGALQKGSSKYNDAADLESGLKGNYSSDNFNSETIGGAKKYADHKSATAQSNAEATALSYANSVITWTVIS